MTDNKIVAHENSGYRWLTSLSQQFLDKDYLVPGETVDSRVDTIVSTAERILNDSRSFATDPRFDGFAARFKENLQKGWYSLSTPIWTNFGNDRGLPISCVTGDTWINTRVDGGKQARDIRVGDEVLTHKGRYRRVSNVMVTQRRDNIYRLKVSTRMTNLYITDNHLVLTNLGWVRVDQLDPERHLVAVNREVEHNGRPHVCDLRPFAEYETVERDGRLWKKGSENVRPDRSVEVVSSYSSPFADIAVDDQLAWALGLWFAEGSISRNACGAPNGIRITLGGGEINEGKRWLDVMCAAFGVNGNGYESCVERNGKNNRWYTVNLNSGIIGKLFETFGDDCKSKTIPQWIMGLPRETLAMFLKGFVFGDGSLKPHDSNRVTLANPQLALQVYQLGLIVGKDMSLQMQEKAGKLSNTAHVYTVLFRSNQLGTAKASGNSCIPFNDGLSYAPIRTLELTDCVEDVYDFTVEEDHSFSAAGVVVHNCFGSHMSDDTASILRAHSEVGMMTKHGGGTSAYFGELRHRGARIRKNGESSGSVHFMQMFDQCMNIISQGMTRRGNFAAYLPIDHPDIMEFLTIRCEGSPIQDMSYGVTVPDYWMEEMIGGDSEKRKVWARVLEQRANFGYPYIMFTDNCNRGTVDVYKRNGWKINHSNLCVIGSQRVVSSRGLKTAKELYEEGRGLTLFDNTRKVMASPMRLVEKGAEVFRITLDNGMTHTVTGYHKVKVRLRTNPYRYGDVACCDLKPGDLVAVQTEKGLFGENSCEDEAFLLGHYQGDGTQTDKEVALDLWENDFDLVEEIEARYTRVCDKHGLQLASNGRYYATPTFSDCKVAVSPAAKKRLIGRALKKLGFAKGVIPEWLWTADEDSQWAFIRGLLLTDGTASVSRSQGHPLQIAIASVHRPFLQNVQLIMANLGMQTTIRLLREGGRTILPDGKGGRKEYDTQDCWQLIVGNKTDALEIERRTGFLSRKGVEIEDRDYRDNTKKFYAVSSIEPAGREDVYCCTVQSDEHHWVCNGVVTHNCSEIMLPDNEEESFVCDLSSMNILYYDEWKDTDAVELLVYFLDAVMTEFIAKAKNIPFMDRPVRFAERHRALGIGWLGWHSALQSKMIPFESLEAKMLNAEVARTIHTQAYAASATLAKRLGEPEVLKGYGRRNTTLLAIAPTKSSAFIMGQVSEGIEPHRTNYYIKDLAKGKFTIKNPYLEKLLQEKGLDTDEVWASILKSGGSVQHLSDLSENERNVFKTFAEITPKEIIIQAATRQKWIDQSQSLNLMIHPSIPIKDVNALMIEAWRMGVKSLYYQISVNAAQQFARNILTCESCSA